MIVVQDIIQEVAQVTGRCEQSYLFSVLTRAVETLARKASQSSLTFDPLMVYVDLPVQQDYYVWLPYQVEKPLKININGQPAFSHSSLYEFTQNGPGSSDMEAGWQWQDRLTSPIQRKFPRGGLTLTAMSDNASDTNVIMRLKVRFRDRSDHYIDLAVALPGGTPTPSAQSCYDILEVVKPVTVGTVTLWAGNYVLAHYYPGITLPEFSAIKLSQKATTVRMLARRKTMRIASLLDVIPLNSAQAIICQCQAIKYQDEVHLDLAAPYEAQAITYLNEEQAARNQYSAASAAAEVTTALNLTIGQRDEIIVADIYDEACRVFGFVGRAKVFDRITSTLELLYNKCQYWDGLMGLVDLRADEDSYVALPRYVDTILAMNVNRTIGAYHSPWFEFSYAGSGEFRDMKQDPEHWMPWWELSQTEAPIQRYQPYGIGFCAPSYINRFNRAAKGWEEVGSSPIAYRLKGPSWLVAVPELAQDNGARITVYGYNEDRPVLNSQGQWGVEIPCLKHRLKPSPHVFTRIERVSKDPTYSFIHLFAQNPFQPALNPLIYPQQDTTGRASRQMEYLSMYWPQDTEPMYRLIRIGTFCKRIRLRYKKNWSKIENLTDPLHVRSREAIILAMTAAATMRTGGSGTTGSPFMPTAPVQIAQDQLQMAVQLLDDEWSARNPHATITLQWPQSTYGNAFAQIL